MGKIVPEAHPGYCVIPTTVMHVLTPQRWPHKCQTSFPRRPYASCSCQLSLHSLCARFSGSGPRPTARDPPALFPTGEETATEPHCQHRARAVYPVPGVFSCSGYRFLSGDSMLGPFVYIFFLESGSVAVSLVSCLDLSLSLLFFVLKKNQNKGLISVQCFGLTFLIARNSHTPSKQNNV